MFKKIVRILLKVIVGLLLAIILIGVFSYRDDLSREALETDYFLTFSQYLAVEIDDLDGNPVAIDVHFLDQGELDDPVVVLLHGAFSSSHTFIDWMELLVASDWRVIAIDLPNHGLTGNFSDNTISQRRSAAVVKAVIDELEITSCVIGGNSMGGGVAWEFASEFHGIEGFSVNGLILIDAVYPDMGSGAPESIEAIRKLPIIVDILSKMTPRPLLKSILKGVYGSESTTDDLTVDRYYDLLRMDGHREALIMAQQETSVETALTPLERLERIKNAAIPVLVLWGLEDAWISVDYAFRFQTLLNLPDTSVLIYTGLGHVPMEENPNDTGADLLAFLLTLE
jgi:pimeloyl-ACP methyl ester carboxylesterase